MVIVKAMEKGVMDTENTRMSSALSKSCAELCLWRPAKEFLPAGEEVLLIQDLYRVPVTHLSMDFHFLSGG